MSILIKLIFLSHYKCVYFNARLLQSVFYSTVCALKHSILNAQLSDLQYIITKQVS